MAPDRKEQSGSFKIKKDSIQMFVAILTGLVLIGPVIYSAMTRASEADVQKLRIDMNAFKIISKNQKQAIKNIQAKLDKIPLTWKMDIKEIKAEIREFRKDFNKRLDRVKK